ncbi:hypothetical protein S83_011888 [Arachis hypogaea]
MEDWFPSLFQVHVRIAYLCEFSLNLSLRLFVDNHCPWKAKCLSLQVLSKLGPNLTSSVVLEVLDMGLHDETEKVRIEAVISMPVMLFWSTLDISSPVGGRNCD